jgi:hypothetical protein
MLISVCQGLTSLQDNVSRLRCHQRVVQGSTHRHETANPTDTVSLALRNAILSFSKDSTRKPRHSIVILDIHPEPSSRSVLHASISVSNKFPVLCSQHQCVVWLSVLVWPERNAVRLCLMEMCQRTGRRTFTRLARGSSVDIGRVRRTGISACPFMLYGMWRNVEIPRDGHAMTYLD